VCALFKNLSILNIRAGAEVGTVSRYGTGSMRFLVPNTVIDAAPVKNFDTVIAAPAPITTKVLTL
jgi:hypothetical protein